MQEICKLQDCRKKYIRALAKAKNASSQAKIMADDLFALDLTVYSSDYSFDSLVYNSLAVSELDASISLHPEQLNIVNKIKNEDALIISAPTSFGKTYCVFEYIVRYSPQNVVLIVPTLALVDEYYKKIIKRYKEKFKGYKIHTNINEDKEYDFNQKNIFVLTHDRVVQESVLAKILKIDFLVVDEVYKLETDRSDDRVLILNMAYYYLAQKARKYVLLAPFIKEIVEHEKLEKYPSFYRSEYSPVVNEIVTKSVIRNEDRFEQCRELVEATEGEKTLIYFATVIGKYGMYKYIDDIIMKEPELEEIPTEMEYFIEWAKEEIHEEWCVIKALKHGYLLHNGQIPVGTRIFQLDQYGNEDGFTKMLCTSTLLEGVNTTAENIIIVQPARKNAKDGENFSAFDFYNLVGRTGRLNQHLIGKAYYIKGPQDRIFEFDDAVKSIKFEILDHTNDMDIQMGNIENNTEVNSFLRLLGITLDDYMQNIGAKLRFATVKYLYENFEKNKNDLMETLIEMSQNPQKGRYSLVFILEKICEGKEKGNSLDASIINMLINKRRPKIKKVVDELKEIYKNVDINMLISKIIRMKNGYIEHTFFNRVNIIRYFCELENWEGNILQVIDNKILSPIEFLYFINLKNKKMLLDLGVYERDIDKIIKVIGDDFDDAVDLKNRLLSSYSQLKGISYISRYVIRGLE